MTIELFAGDDILIPMTLGTVDSDGVFTNIVVDSGDTVTSSLIDRNKNIIIVASSVLEANVGSDWANGVVVAKFTALQTVGLTVGSQAFVEIELDTGLISTFQSEPNVIIKQKFIP